MKTGIKFFTPALLVAVLVAFVSYQNVADAATGSDGDKAAWMTDYVAAKQAAKQQGKPMLLEFTGSDWCPPCMRMKKEVFSQAPFIDYSAEKLVLVKLDFPRRKAQSDELKAQNETLAKQYGVRGFPTVILVSPDGDVLNSEVGFRPGGAESYVEHLEGILASK